MIGALLAGLISAAPVDQGRYVMSVGGAPVGVVSFSVVGGQYTYQSTQVFRSKTSDVTSKRSLAEAIKPEVWWLSRRRAPGCVTVFEERASKNEEVCTTDDGGGTIAGAPFHADYDGMGALVHLEVASVRFDASKASLPGRADPFAEGFIVTGHGAGVEIDPPFDAVTEVTVSPLTSRPSDDDEGTSCLELARAEVAKSPGSIVVLGVVVDGDRAWPHAWVKRTNGTWVDPTLTKALPTRHYLAFSRDAGRLYLELLAGQRRLVRGR